jgi:hypothetical protein
VPRTPQPPRKGHPGQPPRRKGAKQDAAGRAPDRQPHSYGQSAPLPQPPESGRVDFEHESVEELAGEPMREEGEDEPGASNE